MVLNGEKLKMFPEKSMNEISASAFSITVLYSAWILSRSVRQETEVEGMQIRKDEVKLFLFQMIWFYTLKTLKTPPENS
jgi:hypothetical protein